MKRQPAVVLGGLLIAVSGAAAFAIVSLRTQEASAVSDPRQEAPIVRLATAVRAAVAPACSPGSGTGLLTSTLGERA